MTCPTATAQAVGPTHEEVASIPGPSRTAPTAWRGWLIAATFLVVSLVGFLWWCSRHRGPSRGHWDEVERGRAYLHQGRPDLAVQAVSDVRDEAPGSGEAMTVAGLALIRLWEYRAARRALERALKLQPDQFEAATALAELNFGLGDGRRGVEILRQAARLRPRAFRVWLVMGKVLHDLGDSAGSIEAYEKAVAIQPEDRQALVGLVDALIYKGRPEEAQAWVTRALGRYPRDPVLLGLAARCSFDGNRLDEAEALAERALREDPRNVSALLTRARCRIARSRWRDALPDAEGAVAARPNDLGALQLLSMIETQLGMAGRAAQTQARRKRSQKRIRLMTELNEEISQHPEDPQLPWKLGQVAEEAGSHLLAVRCFEAAMALDPSFQPARERIAALRAAHPELARESGRATLIPLGAATAFESSPTDP
jgi:tetratricopeptide (TPR) repeat protein